jgi:polysaccharide biosynthesis transport protein
MERNIPQHHSNPMDQSIAAAALPAPGQTGNASAQQQSPALQRVLWRRRWMVTIPLAAAVLLAIVYIAFAQRMYTAVARFEVKPAGSRMESDSTEYSQLSNFLYTQREKLLSRDVLAGVLGMPIEGSGGRTIKDLETFRNVPNALEYLRDCLEVEVGKRDDTLTVSFEGPDQREVPLILNSVIFNYLNYQTSPNRASNMKDVLNGYRTERDNVGRELAQITEQMSAMERQYGLLSGRDQDNIIFRQLNTISQELATQRGETLKSRQDAEEAAKAVPHDANQPPASLGAGLLTSADDEQSIRSQLLFVQQQLQLYQRSYLPDHPTILQFKQRQNALSQAYADAIQRRYLRSKAIEEDLRKQLDDQNKLAIAVSAKMAEYSRLSGEGERLRRLIETLETRIHAVDLQAATGGVNIDFFDKASEAKRSHPAPKRTLALAILLGLAMGISLALGWEWMDDRLTSAEQIRNSLNLPLLGVVPQMPAVVSPTVTAQKVVLDPTSDVAEAFRSLRTAIYFGAPKDRCKTILVTSPAGSDGKTTVAANLACIMAQSGKHVLLIDADLRNPKQHVVFGSRATALGLTGVLSREVGWERAVQTTPLPNLELMQCGPKPRNPSEMLNSPLFCELLETLAEKYDHVIIDSPPVMGLADARIIAASCDLTIMVLRAQKSTRKLATMSRDGLVAVGGNILRVVVNDVSQENESDYDTGYGYGGERAEHVPARRLPSKAVRSLADSKSASDDLDWSNSSPREESADPLASDH